MYAEALAERRIFCSEKMVLKLGLVIMALAVFSGYNMPLDAYEARTILRGYIQENTMYKEQSDDALFLLQKKWDEDLKEKYPNQKITKVDDGVIYVPIVKYINSRRIKINVAEINRNINKNLEIIPQMCSEKMHSRARINNIAMLNGAILAINGTYFKQDKYIIIPNKFCNNIEITKKFINDNTKCKGIFWEYYQRRIKTILTNIKNGAINQRIYRFKKKIIV